MPRTPRAVLVSLGLLFVLSVPSVPGHADGLGAILGHHEGPGPMEPTEGNPLEGLPLSTGTFSPSLFRFVTTIPDDGQGKGGGYQAASARLNFVDTRPFVPQAWSCSVRVGMPLRTEHAGTLSPEYAAQITADVATEAAPLAMRRQTQWMPVAFCKRFGDEMRDLFIKHYPTVGARVEKSQ